MGIIIVSTPGDWIIIPSPSLPPFNRHVHPFLCHGTAQLTHVGFGHVTWLGPHAEAENALARPGLCSVRLSQERTPVAAGHRMRRHRTLCKSRGQDHPKTHHQPDQPLHDKRFSEAYLCTRVCTTFSARPRSRVHCSLHGIFTYSAKKKL